jgi:predicted O-linked N-acetylglucosamine transferase (SPINDLY family)
MYQHISGNTEARLSHLSSFVDRYQNEPADREALAALRNARQQLARRWLDIPNELLARANASYLGRAHQILLQSGLKYELLTDAEKQFLEREILPQLLTGQQIQEKIGHLLAFALYLYPHHLPLQWHGKIDVPEWFAQDYLRFILASPNYLRTVGEVQQYFQFMRSTIDALYKWVFTNPNSKTRQDIVPAIAQHINLIQLYFTQENLRDIQSQRGDLIELALKQKGAQIDFTFPPYPCDRPKIRLGILLKACNPSPETYLALPLLEHLDRAKFEIILYVFQITGHQLEDYCRKRTDKLVRLANDDLDRQAEIIRRDDLGILAIGANVTSTIHQITLLATYRLARVQITNFASPISTGIKNIDYYIAGKLMEPMPDAQAHYREQLIVIDGTGFCFSYDSEPSATQYDINREMLGIPDSAVVFASTANLFKLIPDLRETWAKILAAVPHSVLMLMPFGPNWMSCYPGIAFVDDMNAILAKYGVAGDRLRVLKALPHRANVKQALKVSDICLDSFPYAGTTSLIDALEVGLPTIAWEGNTLRSRMGAAILKSLAMTDLIAHSEESYVELAITLAENPDLRSQKRQEILQKMQQNPDFLNSRAYVAQMQPLLLDLSERWRSLSILSNFG